MERWVALERGWWHRDLRAWTPVQQPPKKVASPEEQSRSYALQVLAHSQRSAIDDENVSPQALFGPGAPRASTPPSKAPPTAGTVAGPEQALLLLMAVSTRNSLEAAAAAESRASAAEEKAAALRAGYNTILSRLDALAEHAAAAAVRASACEEHTALRSSSRPAHALAAACFQSQNRAGAGLALSRICAELADVAAQARWYAEPCGSLASPERSFHTPARHEREAGCTPAC